MDLKLQGVKASPSNFSLAKSCEYHCSGSASKALWNCGDCMVKTRCTTIPHFGTILHPFRCHGTPCWTISIFLTNTLLCYLFFWKVQKLGLRGCFLFALCLFITALPASRRCAAGAFRRTRFHPASPSAQMPAAAARRAPLAQLVFQ